MTPANINFTPKNMLEVGLDRSPSPGLQARTGWDTYPASLRSSTRKKTSGTKVRRTPDVKLRFVGFISFNFGQIQKIRFVVVIVRSYSFGHLDSVKWLTLNSANISCWHPSVGSSLNSVLAIPPQVAWYYFRMFRVWSSSWSFCVSRNQDLWKGSLQIKNTHLVIFKIILSAFALQWFMLPVLYST